MMDPSVRSPSWEREGRDWPNREYSSFVKAAGLRWHVQRMGEGPVVFLVHGTGSATHSWRSLAPLLASRFTVVAPDLPGHGFTQLPATSQLSLPGMADALHELLRSLHVEPDLVIGHSAGAAILARMCIDATVAPRELVCINGALLPFRGVPGFLFSPVARMIASTSLVPRLLAWRASDRAATERLIRSTGSTIEPFGIELYARLMRTSGHVAATLGMMAQWELESLLRELPALRTPLTLMVGSNDLTVSPTEAQRVRAMLPEAKIVTLRGLGHLAHEERPAEIFSLVGPFADVARARANG